MLIARRTFLRTLLVAAGGAVVAAVGFRASLKDLAHRITDPILDPTPAGQLSEHTVKTLLSSTDAFLGYPIDHEHYADFFRWHAETLPGYRTVYERFTAILNRSARRSHGCDFAECDDAVRKAILGPAFGVHRAQGRLDKARFAIFDRDWRLFDLHILRPVASLFANTDAWRLVGYDAWPGTPRGLERYTQRPGTVK